MDDFTINVRQIVQYPFKSVLDPTDLVLLQESDSTGLAAGAYRSTTVVALLGTALEKGGVINLAPGGGIAWNGASLTWAGGLFTFTSPVNAPSLFINGNAVATQEFVLAGDAALAAQLSALDTVHSFNFRTGDIILEEDDILRAGGAPQLNPHLHGVATAPTLWDARTNNDQIATTAFVHDAFAFDLSQAPVLLSPDCTQVAHPLMISDINAAYGVSNVFPAAPNPPFGDASNRIATTLFVDESVEDVKQWVLTTIGQGGGSSFAPLDSPQFTGIPTAPTANVGTSTGQLATTAFVQAAVAASVAGVASFNSRTGNVTLTTADVTGAGGAPTVSPVFTGVPTAPTAAPGTNSQQLATTAFVAAAIAASAGTGGVVSFNARTGAVVLTTGDITGAGGAPTVSPALSGTPTAPTPAPASNDTTIATTAYVKAAIAAIPAGVSSFNARTGAVTLTSADVSAAGGAPIASPTFTGVPAAPTATVGSNTTQIATTAFVQASITAVSSGVVTFNGRSGTVTLLAADVTGVGGALLASPAFSGTPTAPTAAQSSNDTTLATTAYVHAAVAALNIGVSTFNTRTGAVTLQASDVSAVGGALTASPAFTGTPTAPTATTGTSTTQLATTAFVQNQIASSGGVTTFNGRAGAVTLTGADITGAGGALLASPAFTGSPTAPTATAGTNTTQLATTAFVAAAIAGATLVTSFNTRSGAVTLTGADITGAGGALLASPALTGTPTAPTAAVGTNTTQIATTAFVLGQGFLSATVTATINVGYTFTPYNAGNITTGTFTLGSAVGNYQYYTNNGAHTLAAPAADSAMDILVTNGATAGAITFSGFTVGANVGDALTTVNGNRFIISVRRINAISTYTIKALQ